MNFPSRAKASVQPPKRGRAALVIASLLVLAALAFALSACGSSDGSSDETGATTAAAKKKESAASYAKAHPGSVEFGGMPALEVETDPNGKLAYTTDELTAKEGNVVIEFTNAQSTPHDVAIESKTNGGMVKSKTISKGFTTGPSVSLSAKQEYVFFCTIPGHREAGMEGVLKVVPG